MSAKSRFVSAAIICVCLAGTAAHAHDDEPDECSAMLMPAAQLKQVSRGISPGHSGLDLTAPYGSPVRAASAGRVVFAGRYFGYGNMVDLQHPGGIITRYAHLSAFGPAIRPGHTVETGEVLGRIGTSGNAHGAHVHFEVRINGRVVDPKPYLGIGRCIPHPELRNEIAHAEEARPPVADENRPGGLLDPALRLEIAQAQEAAQPAADVGRPGGLLEPALPPARRIEVAQARQVVPLVPDDGRSGGGLE